MTLELTPVVKPPITEIQCEDQKTVAPTITQIYGDPVKGKCRAVNIKRGREKVIEWQMVDSAGNPVDLTSCGFPGSGGSIDPPPPPPCPPDAVSSSSLSLSVPSASSVSESSQSSQDSQSSMSSSSSATPEPILFPQIIFRMREWHSFGRNCLIEVIGEVVDAQNGIVKVTLNKRQTAYAGVFFGEIAVVVGESCDPGALCPPKVENDDIVFSNCFYVNIERSNWGKCLNLGPPTVCEIRLHIRDNDPAEQLLLDERQWDLAEIAHAIERCVSYWNEIPPPIKTYTTDNFPFRHNWLNGVIAQLYKIQAAWHMANHMPYAAAGVTVNDHEKYQQYEEKGRDIWDRYEKWVMRKKAEINLAGAYGHVGSGYSYAGGFDSVNRGGLGRGSGFFPFGT